MLINLIELEDMEFFAYHGCYKEEQVVGNQFVVNLLLETDTTKADETDRLSDALNYQSAYEIVKREMTITSRLLEHIAGRILKALFNEFEILQSATIKVSKLNPPIGGKMDRVSVTLSKTKQ